jgi:DNA-binding MarR family transcriptional regulator
MTLVGAIIAEVQMSSPTQSPASTAVQHAAELLYALTRRVTLTTTAERIRIIEENELSMTQVKALLLLVEGGRHTGGEIAERLGISPAAASRAVDAMIQKGLASRSECADDRRVRLLEATQSGVELAAGIADLRKAQIERFLETLEPEVLDGLIDALGPLGLEGDTHTTDETKEAIR